MICSILVFILVCRLLVRRANRRGLFRQGTLPLLLMISGSPTGPTSVSVGGSIDEDDVKAHFF